MLDESRLEELMIISASPSSHTAPRYRGGLRAVGVAVCCGLMLSGPTAATAATVPAAHTQAQAQHEERGRGTLVSAEKLYTLATPQAVAAELSSRPSPALPAR
ncbi:hypothetical protein ADK74_21240 [Streptomyces decoyicus]|nr:hypothetical protein ADK74_21240 [Streptomyces decoyicus]